MKLVCQSQLAAKDRAKFLERTYSGLKGSPFFAFSIGACYFDSDKSSIFGQILMVFDRKSGKACAAFVPQDIVQFIADELASFYRASPKPSFLAKLSQELKSLGTDYIAPIVQSVTGWTKDVVRKMVYRAFQWHVPNPYFYLGSRIISDQAHRDDDEH
ncbi:hypothetical protein H4R34_002165 [Dimargaris verticillata]|uniref:Uncharacterized protein n=1 Tax=Dimargaris verticillata TaxID=2761393 RepID=A0A9W8B4A3_9FUNG|nr:hypothetical protein H4R34_002165 [Dimargaris verticillata]